MRGGDHDIRAPPAAARNLLAVVREWLDKITAASTNPDLNLRNLRAVLTHLLEIVEQDPTIDAAVDNLADAASAYLKEVELAAGMQTKAGDRAVARRLNTLELAFAAVRRSLAPAKPRPGVLW
jgi:hypothetical protein